MTARLHAFLDTLEPAPPTRLGVVTLLPLRAPPRGPAVALLTHDSARVHEKGGGGVVGQVDVHNVAPLPLLLLAGELLIGAKQNRIVNASTLVASGTQETLHVSCIEQGRWAFGRGRGRFRAGEATAPWSLRSRSSRSSSRSKRRRGAPCADQRAVWEDVRTHLHARQVSSTTMDLTEAVAGERVRIASLLEGWAPGPEDVGAVLFVGERLIGAEVFGRPETWAAAASRVLAGVVQELPERDKPPSDAAAAWTALHARIRSLELKATRGDGLGEELHGEARSTHVVALLHQDAVVHLRVADGLTDEEEDGGHPRRHGIPGRRHRGVLPALRADAGRLRDERQRLEEAAIAEQDAVLADVRQIARRVQRGDEDTLRIDRPTIVTRARFHRRWHVRRRAAEGLPLPRLIAGGLAAWPLPGVDIAAEFLALIERIGTPQGAFQLIDPEDPPPPRARRWLALHATEPGVLLARAVG